MVTGKIKIRKAQDRDIPWLVENDTHVDKAWLRRCTGLGEIFLAEHDGRLCGFLRSSLFWGTIPYMDIIRVLGDCRRRGSGACLLRAWEDECRARGFKFIMTSSEKDETAPQDWHKRNGFRECGFIDFDKHQDCPEIFFIKEL